MLSANLLGRRIVLRYRRSDGIVPPLSDVVGELVSLTPTTAIVDGRGGRTVVDRAAIEAVRVVAPHRREILELQRIARLGWRAAEVVELDGWQLYADLGWTGRANSVLPLTIPRRPLPELMAAAGRFYAERGLPLQFQLPLPARGLLDAELAGRCWTLERPTLMLTAPLDSLVSAARAEHRASEQTESVQPLSEQPLSVQPLLEPLPSQSWLDGYHYRGGALPEHAVQLLTRHDRVRFASINRAGAVVGIARGTVDEGWLGVTAVEVAAQHRRSGVAGALMRALASWAWDEGASNCYLQVEPGNDGALAFYQRLGFTVHHRYHYRMPPAAA